MRRAVPQTLFLLVVCAPSLPANEAAEIIKHTPITFKADGLPGVSRQDPKEKPLSMITKRSLRHVTQGLKMRTHKRPAHISHAQPTHGHFTGSIPNTIRCSHRAILFLNTQRM